MAGGVVFVDWISAVPVGGPGTVSLELSTHGATGPWVPIATELPNGDRYQWRIPPGAAPTTNAILRYSLSVGSETAVTTTPRPFEILSADPGLVFTDGFDPRRPRPVERRGALNAGATLSPAGSGLAVEVAWEQASGRTRLGQAVPLTPDTGALWFLSGGDPLGHLAGFADTAALAAP